MGGLKQKIIYQYMLLTTSLLIIEAYLFYGCFEKSGQISKHIGIPETVIEVAGLFAALIVFAIVATLYYRKIGESIQEEAKRQVEERNVLFAKIAHDLKNPMSSVLGFARALEEGKVPVEEQQQVVHTICQKSMQVDGMIRRLFQYAKMESEGYELHRKEMELGGMIRGIVAAMYQQLEEKKMELEIDLPEERVMAAVDSTEFPRVIENLVANAIKHNEVGTVIGIRLQQKNDVIRIEVADTGSPIEAAQQQWIFEPFQCSDESRCAKDGSGLGLAIARRIVELHKGKIYIEQPVEGYTKAFVIEL